MSDGQEPGGEDVVGANGVGSAPGGGEAAGDRAGRLGGLLQDLLRTHGRRRTAELLDLSERTLQRVEHAEAGAPLSEQFLRALEDYEASQHGSAALSPLTPLSPLSMETAAELANLRRRLDRLEHALPENIGNLPGTVDRLQASVERLEQQVAALSRGGDDGDTVASIQSVGKATRATGIKTVDSPLRQYPELVTTEAEPGERRFYGRAMPAISAWRRARARRGQASATLNTLGKLDRLRADERLLELELELVREHGLTLPPADRPWDGLRRQTELRVTREALRRVRHDRRRAQAVHWLLRLLTLGLWSRRRS